MRDKWIFVAMAIGGLLAATALPPGAPRARADELSDLRANSQLLQQRIEQIERAQAARTGAGAVQPGAASGTGAAGGSFPRSFQVPGTDTSVRIGGSIATTFGYLRQGGSAEAR